jgi:NodT family efflux transporter outer membrane factor (OMF) lipoprotein
MQANYFYKVVILSVLSILLAGCMVGPNFHEPAAPATPRYTEHPIPAATASSRGPGGKTQYLIEGEDIPAEWWELYHSPELNDLIIRGLHNNPNYHAAQEALCVAQQNWKAQIGTLFPTIDGQFFAQRQKIAGSSFGVPRILNRVFDLFNPQINVSYALDVFGGLRRAVEAAHAEFHYEMFEEQATYLTLTSNIVTTAIMQASLRTQIEATLDLIKTQTSQLQLVRKQFQLGAVSNIEVLAQETQLAQTQATLPALEKEFEQTRDALAVLVGSLPSESFLPDFELNDLHLPTHLPLSLPSLLVRQRPDIRASEALLHQASAQIGVATANLFPNITLTGYYGSQSNSLDAIFASHNEVWSYGVQILQPIFHGGTLLARRRAAIAAYRQAYDQYHEVVLQGFQNVADVLHAIHTDALALQAQTVAESTARKNLNLVRKQYQLGGVNYLFILNAQLQYQQARISRIQAEAARYTDTAALFQALGGGWWNNLPHPQKRMLR